MSLIFIYSSVLSGCGFSGLLMSDGLSSSLVVLSWWISLLMLIASQGSVKSGLNKYSLFSGCVCALNFILMVSFFCVDIVWFYVFFEASLIPTFILILGWGYQPERLQAGMYMMLYTITASLPLLVLILYKFELCGTSSFLLKNFLCEYVGDGFVGWSGLVGSEVVFCLGFGAFLVKLPMFSLHLWLPKAHVEAPVAGSMILAGVLLKLGGYGMIRVYGYFCLSSYSVFSDVILCLALWGGVVTGFICFRQVDLKSLIAYSSVGHMSLMLGGCLSNSSWGWQAALGMMLAHGLCSSGMFALANYNYEKTGTRSLVMSKGMLMISPYMSMWWFLFCVANMAGPPSINLLSEIMVFPSVLFKSLWLFFPLGLMSFLAAVYSLFLYTSTQHGGFPKFGFPYGGMNSSSSLVAFLHYFPINGLILKSDLVCFWVI
uniref:NADH-ubiquinone oxidoreductase chain 4 n=1 Tax=Haliotis iris TaxID=36096 RepID=A0A1C9IIJ7_HALIR|nr:NADH dehydrogenase subunit 4 [Haliotis iris]AOP04365.1 NADH dehydrogenase subunit 4 [Haliotis iris]